MHLLTSPNTSLKTLSRKNSSLLVSISGKLFNAFKSGINVIWKVKKKKKKSLHLERARPKRFYCDWKIGFILASRVKLHLSFWDVVKYLDAIFIQTGFPLRCPCPERKFMTYAQIISFHNNCSTLLWFDRRHLPFPLSPYTQYYYHHYYLHCLVNSNI